MAWWLVPAAIGAKSVIGKAALAKDVLVEAADEDLACRYVGETEATAFSKSGRIPNLDLYGNAKSIFTTPNYYETAGEAEAGLRMGRLDPSAPLPPPTHRVVYYRNTVHYSYAGNVEGGTGIEMVTNQPIPVVRIDPLR